MIEDLKTVRGLVRRRIGPWAAFSVLGALFIAGLDMLGVAAMLPLMQAATGAPTDAGALGIVSGALGTTDVATLVMAVAGVVALAFILKSVVTVLFRWWQLGVTTQLEAEAGEELLGRYIRAPYWAHRTRKLAEVHRSIASTVPQTFSQVVQGLLSWGTDALTLVALALVLMLVSPLATLLAAALFVGTGWGVQRFLRRRHTRVGETIAQSDLDAWTAFMPAINGFREARLAGAGEMFVRRFGEAKMARARAYRELSLISELPKYVLEIAFVVGIAGVAALLFAVQGPASAVSVLGVFAAGSTRLLPTINRLVATTGGIRAGSVGMRILVKELRQLNEHGSFVPAAPTHRYSGDILLEDVSFSFPDSDDVVLRNISATIRQGQTTAFVGSSGAGKSTLLDIVLGLLEPTTGTVRCGGVDLREDPGSWYSGLGVVPQDVFLLDDTLRSNIAFGDEPSAVESARLDRAIRLAQLGTFIEELPDGLETRLGERGVRLSGGQRQRVGIARALYRDPQVLVLDEATSALDNATEYLITETLESLAGTMTVIVVAHRLSTVKNAHKVIFMSNGGIEAEGTFNEVEELSSEFAHLVALGKL